MLKFTAVTEENLISPRFFYLVERIGELNRKSLLDWFSIHERRTLDLGDLAGKPSIAVTSDNVDDFAMLDNEFTVHVPKKGTMQVPEDNPLSDPTEDMYVYGVYHIDDNPHACMLLLLKDKANEPVYLMNEQFELLPGMIENYKGTKPIITDVGKFMLNSLVLVRPFGDFIPYWNERFDLGKVDNAVAHLILEKKITRAQYNQYITNGTWYGQDGSICTVAWTSKAITTDPAIEKRRAELLEKYKNQLDDPIILAKIEKELTAIDEAWIMSDESAPFYAVTRAKSFGDQRKKMYIMFGMSTQFDKNTGKYEFTQHSLAEGWRAESIATCANDIRKGSYNRGVETAKGGEQTKLILRIFQNVRITEDDCGTKRGMEIEITPNHKKDWLGRYLTNGTMLTEENIDSYVGKTVKIRSPMTCQTPGSNFCYKCCGEKPSKRGVEAIGLDAINISSTFTLAAMKAMHVSTVGSIELPDITRFIQLR